ncbi:glycosyltransferase family 4 protein [Mariniflexile soesokkakense]|uniref:Glycosyltransferase family 4 protein n=1 Tax=Mariniflexile soesokkakense TaxID=1343160 RepID=A0ABV0AAJ4_9FLAO
MKKKICFVVSTTFTMQFLRKQLEEFSKDYIIHVVANIDDQNVYILNQFPINESKNIAIDRNINILNDFKAIYELYKYFKLNKFDSIHSITPKAGLISAIAGKLARVNNRIHIFTGQVWATKQGLFRSFLKFLDKIIVAFSTHILVDGNSQRNFLVSEKVLKKNQGLVLGTGSISGVDLNRFSANLDMRLKLRSELNFTDNIVVYLFLGRLNIDKGVIELAKAFNKLSKENKNVFLLLVGDDEAHMMDKLNTIIENKKSFVFVGETDNPEYYYQASDVFCLPSYREGFGMSVIEASATKLPVICSDAYGLMDTILDNKTGLRHKVKDVEGLYNQMKKLSENKDLRDQLGANGLKYISDNFSSDIIVNEWVKFYKELLKK